MAKKKIPTKAVIGGIIVLGLIGSVSPGDTPEEPTEEAPSVQEEVVDASTGEGFSQEELIAEEKEPIEEPAESPAPEPAKEPEPSEPASKPAHTEPQTPSESASGKQEDPPATAPAESVKSDQTPAIDPEQAFRESLYQYKYVGSSESDRYHYPSCRWTSKINDGNLVHFDSEEEAVAAGYFPCGTCNP